MEKSADFCLIQDNKGRSNGIGKLLNFRLGFTSSVLLKSGLKSHQTPMEQIRGSSNLIQLNIMQEFVPLEHGQCNH